MAPRAGLVASKPESKRLALFRVTGDCRWASLLVADSDGAAAATVGRRCAGPARARAARQALEGGGAARLVTSSTSLSTRTGLALVAPQGERDRGVTSGSSARAGGSTSAMRAGRPPWIAVAPPPSRSPDQPG